MKFLSHMNGLLQRYWLKLVRSFIIACQAYPDTSTSKSEYVDFSPFAIGLPTCGKLASLGIEPGSPDPQSNPKPNIQTGLMTHFRF